jgi:ribose transport system ATP-binding protein
MERSDNLAGNALEMIHISKVFPGVKALDDVTFKVKSGEVHALVGENGAGKSTLMKILDGVYKADEGKIIVNDNEVSINNTNDAKDLKIGLIFQEFNLIPSLSVSENIFLGSLKRTRARLVDWKSINKKSGELLKSLDFGINPRTIINKLSIAEKQLVEIAKALASEANIIIMDEPTSSLTSKEIDKLFTIIKDLKQKGYTIIYISHHLEEIFYIADTVTVLRDGKVISTEKVTDETKNSIVEKMVGRPITMEFPKRKSNIGEVILEVESLCSDKLKNISFKLYKGEILGISGLVGSGRTELAEAIFGEEPPHSGRVKVNGDLKRIRSTVQAKKNKIALIPEDRKEEGLVLNFSVLLNSTICNLNKIKSRLRILSSRKEKKYTIEMIKKLGIKTPSINQKTLNLSGGNQQKTVIAKWLFAEPDILIMDEPTRGIDVGAKFEIYQLMNAMVAEGKAIIMISSELPEVLGMSDRLIVMSNGEVQSILDKEEFDANIVMEKSIGLSGKD